MIFLSMLCPFHAKSFVVTKHLTVLCVQVLDS